jgi:hypothetical protein
LERKAFNTDIAYRNYKLKAPETNQEPIQSIGTLPYKHYSVIQAAEK